VDKKTWTNFNYIPLCKEIQDHASIEESLEVALVFVEARLDLPSQTSSVVDVVGRIDPRQNDPITLKNARNLT